MKLVADSTYECWLWEDRKLTLLLVITVVAVPITFLLTSSTAVPYAGLFPALMGAGFYVVYKIVGNKVKKLYDDLDVENEDVSDALIVNGVIQSPGIVVFRESKMELIPIVGQPVVVSFSDVTDVKEVKTFNGSVLWGKKGFWFTIPRRARLGFAVSNSVADLRRDRIGSASTA
jgi:K+ transporter